MTTLAPAVLLACVFLSVGSALAQGLDARPPNRTCLAPDRPGGTFPVRLEPVFPRSSLLVPLAMQQSPVDPAVWYVAQRVGYLERIRSDVPEQTRALDIRSRVVSTNEGGLLGIALHPQFEANGELYVYYTKPGPSTSIPMVSILSRFTSADGGLHFDPASEEVLLALDQTTGIHKAGDIHFGPDGYLYVALGDGGDQLTAQDPENLFGSFLRIDVDGGVPYAIPADNPFAAGGAGAPEVWAWGFRNPYRWSFDLVTHELWAGDVGTSKWEELNVVVRGGNYGWPIREGAHCSHHSGSCDATGLIDPVLEYSHDAGCAVLAGPVYRGAALPELDGAVLYADLCSARIWAGIRDAGGRYAPVDLLTSPTRIYGFAQDAAGEVYVLQQYGVARIVPDPRPEPAPFPATLSETGCVDPDDPKRPAAGLIPYDVIEPLWSDGAAKERWLALPDGARIHVGSDGDFELPTGSVLVKSFSLGNQLIETRLFVRHGDGGWAGYSYEWNDEQTEAFLLPGSKQRTVQGQVWTYPSREQCMSCHTFAAGYSLGLEVLQLNRQFTYRATGRTANQLETFAHIGLFDAPLAEPARELPFLSRDGVDAAARSYLHANCSNCHRLYGPAGTPDMPFTAPLSELRLCNVHPSYGTLGIAGARVLVPGDTARSLLSIRPHRVGPGQMPPLARALVDPYGTQVIDDWIRAWSSCDGPDGDGDGLVDASDNCPTVANAGQQDGDADGIGDACETVCHDGVDNDHDGKVDYPADPGCAAPGSPTESPACDDGVDNDRDGRTDGPWDVACEGPWGASERSTCEDGHDNDFDGALDFDGGASRNGGVAIGPPDPVCVDAPWSDLEAGGAPAVATHVGAALEETLEAERSLQAGPGGSGAAAAALASAAASLDRAEMGLATLARTKTIRGAARQVHKADRRLVKALRRLEAEEPAKALATLGKARRCLAEAALLLAREPFTPPEE